MTIVAMFVEAMVNWSVAIIVRTHTIKNAMIRP